MAEFKVHKSADNSPEAIRATLAAALGVTTDSKDSADKDPEKTKLATSLRQSIARGDDKPLKKLIKGKNGDDFLFWCAGENQIDLLQAMLNAGADPNTVGEFKMRPLNFAALGGHAEALRILLDAGADPNAVSGLGPPILDAAKEGHVEAARILLERGAAVKGVEWLGGSNLLAVAAEAGAVDLIPLLLKAGVDPNAADGRGRTPIMEAAERGHAPMIRDLLAAGANVDQPRLKPAKKTFEDLMSEKSAAIILAAQHGHLDAVRELLKAKPELTRADGNNLTAYDWARKNKHAEIAKLLREAADARGLRQQRRTLSDLLASAESGDVAGIREANKAGVPVDDKDAYTYDGNKGAGGMTALMLAARGGNVDTVRALLELGAKVNEQSNDNLHGTRSAIFYAAEAGHADAVKLLIDAGADVSLGAQSLNGNVGTAIHAAAECGHLKVVKVLLDAGAKADDKSGGDAPLHRAASKNRLDVIEYLLDHGAKLAIASRSRGTPLHGAASQGQIQAVRLLIARGTDVNALSKGGSPLDAATMRLGSRTIKYDGKGNQVEEDRGDPMGVIRVLLDAGADPNLAPPGKSPPLFSAVQHLEALKLLLEHGADPNVRQGDDWSPLAWAVAVNKPEAVKLLLHANADPNTIDNEGRSPLDLAIDRDRPECNKLLEAAGAKRGKDMESGKAAKKELTLKKHADEKAREDADRKYESMLPDFKTSGASKSFKDAVRAVAKLIDADAKPLKQVPGGVMFKDKSITRAKALELLAAHHAEYLKKGCYLFSCGRSVLDDEPDLLALLPTADKYAVMLAMGTNAANFDKGPVEVVEELRAIEQEQPFELTHITFDRLEGRWTTPIKNPGRFAKRLYQFCPDIVDQGVGSVAALSKTLKKSNRLYFWWD